MGRSGLWSAVVDGARLALPVECAGCGLADARWCQECEAPWWEEPVRSESSAPRLEGLEPTLPVWSVAVLEGAAQGTLAAWKDGGRRDLDADLAAAMRRAARHVSSAFASLGGAVSVVPCPARAAHTRRRGVDLPGVLARAAARGLSEGGVPASPATLLRAAPGASRGAGDRERWRGAPPVVARPRRGRTRPVVLVDDVLTTGATLAHAVRALSAGVDVPVAALVLAVAPGVHSRPPGALL